MRSIDDTPRFNSQHQQKNVNKKRLKIFSFAKNVFNIVMGNLFFPYLLTHLHIKPRHKRGFLFALLSIQTHDATKNSQKMKRKMMNERKRNKPF